MMKKSTFLASLLALMAPLAMQAADVFVHAGDMTIEEDAVFDRLNQNIGNCSPNTRVCLGEIDFGATGDNFQATSIEFANGWFADGWAVLHAGATYETSVPFTQMSINETGGYQRYGLYGANMAYNATSLDELPYGPAMEGITYVKPTGRQKVWMTFVGGSGNIRSINFYENAFTAEDFLNDEGDWDSGIRLLNPNEKPGYDLISHKIFSVDSEPAIPIGEGTDYPDTRIDTSAAGANAWGWTKEGFIADYGTVDFGNGKYRQLVCYMTHWASNIYDYLEFYIDDVTEANKILTVWSGLDLGNQGPFPFAKNLPNITGQHKVLVKWRGGSTNLQAIEFVEDILWVEHVDCGIVLEDVEPDADAFHFTFEACPEGQGNPWGYEVKCHGQYEAAGNIGYTGNGTVIDFFGDGDGVDFGDGGWTRIIVNHSSEPSWIGDIDRSNFSFYIDLDPDFIYTPEDWSQNLAAILEGHEPIAVVRLQGTGAWSVRKRTAGEFLVNVTGKHDLFMVYNTPNYDTGANVWDIWFDKHVDQQGIPGDVDGNGSVGVEDVNAVINVMLGKSENPNADLNGNGSVGVEDVNAVINIMLGK